ncbi:unannotated protein [freshwater metagenome]|uniref:Unannotated protein n=1 Tax=freshwater metagenome TaxID=449393 RepID=A0A6J6WRQ1_9ZZZZ
MAAAEVANSVLAGAQNTLPYPPALLRDVPQSNNFIALSRSIDLLTYRPALYWQGLAASAALLGAPDPILYQRIGDIRAPGATGLSPSGFSAALVLQKAPDDFETLRASLTHLADGASRS